MSDVGPTPSSRGPAGTSDSLAALLDHDPEDWRSALDRRYAVLDDVLDGRRSAIVYPAARLGRDVVPQLTALGVLVAAYGDRDPSVHGGAVDGLPVLSPARVAVRHQADVILVASTMYDSAIREDLESRGCQHVIPFGYLNLRLPHIFRTREYDGAWKGALDPTNRPDIEAAHALLGDLESRTVFEGKLGYYLARDKANIDGIRSTNTIYFDRSVHALNPEEVVVDGGAFVGDTLSSFVGESAGRFRAYYAFEPDPVSFDRLEVEAARDPARVTAVRAGLARQTSSARLLSTHGADARFLGAEESGGDEVPVVGLDEYFAKRRPPTLIKMDIEGAEADALHGAARIIAAVRPKLAISAYHYPTDLWRIPLLLQRLMPDSRLYLRHYTREVDDTVCYAIPGDKSFQPLVG
ncbi:MAG: FkbM family methyltransferase [Chloroflexi bacterium]|nr:FkbM family methyltransferase [Chloroflexota bacterium]